MRQYLVRTSNAVGAAIEGLQATSPFPIERVGSHFGVVYRGNLKRKVKLLAGGGSGHEPLFLGAVGPGMADGAIAGEIFTAPNPFSILAVTEALQPCEAVIYLYGNYTGDVLNFGIAAEEARAKGINVEEIRVHDDVASASSNGAADRRGIAGDIFVLRCVAAAADRGNSLSDVLAVGARASNWTRSIGVALRAASSIDSGQPMFELPAGEIEIGMGLHGEMGVQRSSFEPVETLVPRMLALILADFQSTGIKLERAAVMVNGLGSTTVLELLAVAGQTKISLGKNGIETPILATGQFATSLDMAGFSITLIRLDDDLQELLTAAASSFAYSTGRS
ncbi:MAG: dihydroxyacetone kinase subunit DhaK [Verrucomicrobia bacterium]|nr:dihydroxyacetone kinase subunit DhaK [Verrucomicrobiota bacterium]